MEVDGRKLRKMCCRKIKGTWQGSATIAAVSKASPIIFADGTSNILTISSSDSVKMDQSIKVVMKASQRWFNAIKS
jgi:hypothetical protein